MKKKLSYTYVFLILVSTTKKNGKLYERLKILNFAYD
jgi:hypothetical protein